MSTTQVSRGRAKEAGGPDHDRTDVPSPHDLRSRLDALWRFGRPHTLVGTSLSVAGLYAILVAEWAAAPSLAHGPPLFLTWGSAIAANFFIVGLNQLTDVEIDRVNKPELPVASGALSPRAAGLIVSGSAAASLVVGAMVGPAMVVTVGCSMAIGAAYSLRPLRLKRFALWAAASVAVVRGLLVNVGVYAALEHGLFGVDALAWPVPPQVWALAGFVSAFGVAIAVAKDVPDVAGDRRFAVASLAVRLGPEEAFRRARAVLSAAYIVLVAVGLLGLPGVDPLVLLVSHVLLLAALWIGTSEVDFLDPNSVRRAYRLVWWLFYAEYIVYPAACLLA